MCHNKSLSIFSRAKCPLFLFAFGGLLCRALLGFRLGLRFGLALGRLCRSGFAFGRSGLCLFRLGGRQVGSGKALAIESDFGDPYGSKRLAMSVNFFVLLFALEVEDQDLVRLAAFHYLPTDDRTGAWAD